VALQRCCLVRPCISALPVATPPPPLTHHLPASRVVVRHLKHRQADPPSSGHPSPTVHQTPSPARTGYATPSSPPHLLPFSLVRSSAVGQFQGSSEWLCLSYRGYWQQDWEPDGPWRRALGGDVLAAGHHGLKERRPCSPNLLHYYIYVWLPHLLIFTIWLPYLFIVALCDCWFFEYDTTYYWSSWCCFVIIMNGICCTRVRDKCMCA
jgi:hypothetical protein